MLLLITAPVHRCWTPLRCAMFAKLSFIAITLDFLIRLCYNGVVDLRNWVYVQRQLGLGVQSFLRLSLEIV